MQEFAVAADGRIMDLTVKTVIENVRAEAPQVDEASIEAHMTLWRAHNVYAAALAQAYEEIGLSVPRFNMLRWLYHSPTSRRSITELGAYLDASAPNITRMVRSLEEKGWVTRSSSEDDRRVVLVELTEKGRSDFSAMLPVAAGIWTDIWAGLSLGEKASLSHILAKLRLSLLSRYIGHDNLFTHRLERQTLIPEDDPQD